MKVSSMKIVVAAIATLVAVAWFVVKPAQKVDFSADVKPIFNKKCISCHGGVKQQAGFSLLFREQALAVTENGKRAIVPGDPDASEMIRRISLNDPEERMPYKHEPLSPSEITVLKSWVKQGAKWGEHWAYVPVRAEGVPKPSSSFFGLIPAKKWSWVRNDIDYFIYKQLTEKDLSPSAEADKAVLLRRVSMDLTGIPPDEKWATALLSGTIIYEQFVDSLLDSPHFGERWASVWMDLARYADTKGYERDDHRSIWRYRDWLIKAFNDDKPYDQFLTDQLAGDLLPEATDEQFIATAFHRNTMTNDEGGTDNEEFRTAAVVDRVNTTWEALMGTTFGCVQCHSHPYDPFRHDEYYKFMAFFNNTRDEDSFGDYPVLRQFSSGDSVKLVEVANWIKNKESEDASRKTRQFIKTWQPAYNSLVTDKFVNCELSDTKWLAMRKNSSARLRNVDLDEKSEFIYRFSSPVAGGKLLVRLDNLDGPVMLTQAPGITKGWEIKNVGFNGVKGVHDIYFTYTNTSIKDPEINGLQFDWFYFTNPVPGKGQQGYDSILKYYWDLVSAKTVSTTPVMMDNPADMFRETNVFERGNWLVKGDKVAADVPGSLGGLPKNAPRNRLGLALWLTDKKNPLTARTMVNRLWEQLFGAGLVETLEDMGTQGAEPTHRELLDYLSYQFMHQYNWSIKKIVKEIVMSATYRQDSKVSKEGLEKDPFNKYYARGARVRLSAEQIRDQALKVSGLLSTKMYGASVMPWQPSGIWMSPWNGNTWKKSEGEDQYRRALYTFWKRTSPYPSMISFDGVGREFCLPRRIRTNTPLQALVTLNDPVYLEASRFFAFRMQEAGGADTKSQIQKGYEMAMYKPVSADKLKILEDLYRQSYTAFKNDKDKIPEMTGAEGNHNNAETAALVVVANAILNLDEWITKN